jgi:hypothetical protein
MCVCKEYSLYGYDYEYSRVETISSTLEGQHLHSIECVGYGVSVLNMTQSTIFEFGDCLVNVFVSFIHCNDRPGYRFHELDGMQFPSCLPILFIIWYRTSAFLWSESGRL